MNSLQENPFYIIRLTDDGLELQHSKKMLWRVYMPLLLFFISLFIYLTIVVDNGYIRVLFILLTILFLLGLIFIMVKTFQYQFILNQRGIFEKNILSAKCMEWGSILDIGICCNMKKHEHTQYKYDYPRTTLYFCQRHLTDHEKRNFYDSLPIKKKMIYIEGRSCEEMNEVFELIFKYIKKYSNLSLTKFNCQYLNYGVE